MAAGHTGNLPPVMSGKVLSVKAEGGTLHSFVLQRPSTISAKHRRVTIAVTATTKYLLDKNSGSSSDVRVGASVLVRLAAALQNGRGEAVRVTIKAVAHPSRGATSHVTQQQHHGTGG